MTNILKNPIVSGVALLFVATLTATTADGTIKELSSRLSAPQVFFLSGLLMAFFSLISAKIGSYRRDENSGILDLSCLRTSQKKLILFRSMATILSAMGFFHAVAYIPLAEVFLFIGLMPLISAVASQFILGEKTHLFTWCGLFVGFIGVALLFPSGVSSLGQGHLFGFLGALSGTLSLVISRLIVKYEKSTLVQVFYPNLALSIFSILLLPSVWKSMSGTDLALIVLYSFLLFAARWTMVLVMQRLRAPVALPLMNIQFVWMVAVGFFFFSEVPSLTTVTGALFVMLAGLIALGEQARFERISRLAKASLAKQKASGTMIPAE